MHLTVRHGGCCYYEKGSVTDANIAYYNVIPAHVDVLKNYAISVDNFAARAQDFDEVEVISSFFHSYAEREECKRRLTKNDEIRVVDVADSNIEILSINAGKSAGLSLLTNLLGLKKENVAAVGDSGNDLPMMQSAGLRIAVSNATDALKSVSDKIICSNNEHALMYILNNIIK